MVLTIYHSQLTKSETVKTVTVRAFSFKPTVKTVGNVVIFTKCTNSVKLCDRIRLPNMRYTCLEARSEKCLPKMLSTAAANSLFKGHPKAVPLHFYNAAAQ